MRSLLLLVVALVPTLLSAPIPDRYIVELAGPPVAAIQAQRLRPGIRSSRLAVDPEVTALRARIQQAQRQLARTLHSRGARVLDTADTAINALFVHMNERTAQEVSRMPGVLSVTPDNTRQLKLERALDLSKIVDAWERIGGIENAGADIGIAILDSGIDASHPGFQDSGLETPEGYPRFSNEANEALVNNKILVARSYEQLAPEGSEYGEDAVDRNGHGTSVACAAACAAHAAPKGYVSGAAPKAYLGNYKVAGQSGIGPDSMVLKAIDDAIKDGADILNLSFGSELAKDPAKDPLVRALNTAADAGLIVTAAAGNEGPYENTINSPGTAEKVITVASSSNDREFTEGGQRTIDPNRISTFSSRGPNYGRGVKPDLAATGDNLYMADSTQKEEPAEYTVEQGTSFASPLVAGAAAVLKSARPDLTSADYRSLLINSATELVARNNGQPHPIRHQGAGRLNLVAALQMPLSFAPSSVMFGIGGASASFTREVFMKNLTDQDITVALSIRAFNGRPAPRITSATSGILRAGLTTRVVLDFSATELSGEYEGVLLVRNNRNEHIARIPYWYGVRSAVPRSITLLGAKEQGETEESIQIGVRVLDASGIDVANPRLTVTPRTPGSKLVKIEADPDYPGVLGVELQLVEGENVFALTAGGVTRVYTVQGQ